MPTSTSDMPFHARFGASATGPQLSLILQNEAQIVADHDAGRISDAEFEAFRQRGAEQLEHLLDLSHHSKEADAAHREIATEASQELEAARATPGAAEEYRVQQEANLRVIRDAAELNIVQDEFRQGWVEAAGYLIDLRASYAQTDVASVERDRATLAESAQGLAAATEVYADRTATAIRNHEQYLAEADRLAAFEAHEEELTARVKEAAQEQADRTHQIDALQAEKSGLDPNATSDRDAIAEIDERVTELRVEQIAHNRAVDETIGAEYVAYLEANAEIVQTYARPSLESSNPAEAREMRAVLAAELAENERQLDATRAELASRAETYAEFDAAMAQNETLRAEQQVLLERTADAEEFTKAQNARVAEYKAGNDALKEEIAATQTELQGLLQADVADALAQQTHTTDSLAMKAPDPQQADSAAPSVHLQADGAQQRPPEPFDATGSANEDRLERLDTIRQLETTVAELQERLIEQMERQMTELREAKQVYDADHPPLSPSSPNVHGDDAADARVSTGGARTDAGGHGIVIEAMIEIDAPDASGGAVTVTAGRSPDAAAVIEASYADDTVPTAAFAHDETSFLVDTSMGEVEAYDATDVITAVTSHDVHTASPTASAAHTVSSDASSGDGEGATVDGSP